MVKERTKMMNKFRVLLVNPNIPMMLVPSLAMGIFTWVLRREGFEVELFETTQYADGSVYSPINRVKYLQYRNVFAKENLELLDGSNMVSDFRSKLESFKPDLLLYSFTEDALNRALQLLRISNPFNMPTVVGGILATAAPDWLLSFPEVSMLGVGEGEEVVRELGLRLSRGEDISDIKSLWFKQPDGSIKRNSAMPLIDLNLYATDFSVFDNTRFIRPMGGKIFRSLPIESYRGCPHRCTYCNSPMHNRIAKESNQVYLRRKSMQWIKDEITHLIRDHSINHLYFTDDSFLARPKCEIDAFIDMYKEFRLPFWFNTRPEHCTLDALKRLKEIGLFRVSFGIESGNEEFRRKTLGKDISNAKLLECFDIINESGIEYCINYIIGLPYETREMIFDTIKFAKKIEGYDSLSVAIFTPYRGTVLRDEAVKKGWLDPEARTEHSTASSMLDMPHLTSVQIDGLMRTFPLYVKFDESMWSDIEKAEKFDTKGEEIFNKYSKMYRQEQWGEADETKQVGKVGI